MKRRTVSLILILLTLAAITLGVSLIGLQMMKEKEEVVEEEVVTPEFITQNLEIEKAGDIVIHHEYLDVEHPRRPGEIRAIKYVTIHETDNRNVTSDAKAHQDFLLQNFQDITSWHYTVDDHSIYHHLPDNEVAWNAGDGRTRNGGNINGIGIEMCVSMGIDYDKTMDNTAKLTAALLVNYNLPVDHVRLHQDFMNKVCPHRMITEGRVEDFKNMVADEYYRLLNEKESEGLESE